MKREGYYGASMPSVLNAQMARGWDIEEDLSVPAGNTDVTAGNFSSVSYGGTEPRNKYYARSIHNNTDTDGVVAYTLIDHTGVTFTAYINSGESYDVGQNIASIIGTGGDTTVTAIKIKYLDRSVVDGTGENKTS